MHTGLIPTRAGVAKAIRLHVQGILTLLAIGRGIQWDINLFSGNCLFSRMPGCQVGESVTNGVHNPVPSVDLVVDNKPLVLSIGQRR